MPRCAVRRHYRRLGWPVTGDPPELVAGVRFDALKLPASAGLPLLARTPHAGPALRSGPDMWLLVAEGVAAEVPGLLRWLEWGTLATELGLIPVGAGGRLPAPAPPEGCRGPAGPAGPAECRPREAAVWLRPPVPGREAERALLPALFLGGHGPHGTPYGRAPDLVRLIDTAAAECHRARMRPVPGGIAPPAHNARGAGPAADDAAPADQPLAFS